MWQCQNKDCENFEQELKTTEFVTTGDYVGAGSVELGGRHLEGKKWKMSKRVCPVCKGDVKQVSGGILRQAAVGE
jgi:hypothetical protein